MSSERPTLAERITALEPLMLTAILSLAVTVRLFVATHFSINYDEFHYLAQVHEYLRGELPLKLQTFHVHFFGWLARLSLDETGQIIAARAVMLGLHLVTAWLLYRLARRVAEGSAAKFAAAAYLSVSFVVWTGASFRADPIAICLIMGALNLLLNRSAGLWLCGIAGFLLAFAGMITIKTSLFLPTILLILCVPFLRQDTVRLGARRALTAALVAAGGFAGMYAVHSRGVNDAVAQSSAEVAASGLSKTVTQAGIFPRLEILSLTLRWDVIFWACWLLGLGVLVRRIRRSGGMELGRWLEVAALALPVASLGFYRNSFSYFYPSILAPASVLLALAWQALSQTAALQPKRTWPAVLKGIALLWCLVSLTIHGVYLPTILSLEPQRRVLTAVHRVFPSPVPYLDASSMVASFPQVGFFMTSWGIEAYREHGVPVLKEAIEARQPPLLLANHALLDLEKKVFPPGRYGELLPADREALLNSFIHHWGPIYVAGRSFDAPEGVQPRSIDLRIGGRYTLESDGPVSIDGRVFRPGESVELTRGDHLFASVEGSQRVTLRWGEALYRPPDPPPAPSRFLGF
jgi:hypothetical protein